MTGRDELWLQPRPADKLRPVSQLSLNLQESVADVSNSAFPQVPGHQTHGVVRDLDPFPSAAARHHAIPIPVCKAHHLKCLADCTDLIYLEQDSIRSTRVNSFLHAL